MNSRRKGINCTAALALIENTEANGFRIIENISRNETAIFGILLIISPFLKVNFQNIFLHKKRKRSKPLPYSYTD